MEGLINFWTVSMVTVLSMALALLIETALLKVVFSCLAHVNVETIEREPAVIPGRRWIKRTFVEDLRNAGM